MTALPRAEAPPPAPGLVRPDAPALRALLAHPAFPAAMRASAAHLIAMQRGNRLPRLIFSDRSRAVLAFLAVGLAEEGGGTVSVGRLVAVAVAQGLCGRGRALAIIAALRIGRHVAAETVPGDRRLVLLRPGARLMEALRLRLAGHLRAMAPIFPEARQALALIADDAGLARLVACGVRHYLAGFRLVALAPELAMLAERDAGALLACELLLALPERGAGPPAPLSISALAQGCGVSRAHVRMVLGEIEARRLVETRRQDKLVEGRLTGLTQAAAPAFAGLFLVLREAARQAAATAPVNP